MSSFYKGNVEQEGFEPIYEEAIKQLNAGLAEVKAEGVKAQGSADRAGTNADIAVEASNQANTALTEVKGLKADIDTTAGTVGSLYSQVVNNANQVAQDKASTATYASNALASQNAAKVSETNSKQSELVATNAVVTTTQNRDACAASQLAASNSANVASTAATEATEAASKSQEIYEAFAKGAVYRGVWNPSSQAYPDGFGINSNWDVALDSGLTEYDWNGIKWFSGDRLIYSAPDNQYFHISRVSGVITVNGRGGNVTITADELKAVVYDSITGSASLPKGTTTERTANPTGGELRFNTELKEFEGFDTKEWGTIGGGGVPKFISQTTSFTVANRSAYKVSMLDGTSKTATVPAGLDNNSWFAISTVDWDRGLAGLTATVQFGTEVLTNGQEDFDGYIIDRPCVLYFLKAGGKWTLVDGIGVDGSYNALENKVQHLESRLDSLRSTCLVNAVGTGAPHETVVAQLPATVGTNTRLVLPNPFGNNTPVEVEVQAFLNNKWGVTGYVYTSGSGIGIGVTGGWVQGEGIIIQTGGYIASRSDHTGGVHGNTTASVTTPPPVRVFVTKRAI